MTRGLFLGLILTGTALLGLEATFFWRRWNARRSQRRFIRETLARAPRTDARRIIVSLSSLPDRIAQVGPTLDGLLAQTRPPDEIILALPDFSIRQQRSYEVPDFLREIPRLRILPSERDWGPATKFIPAIQHEMAAGRPDTLIIVLDDDRVYPLDAVETYLHYERELPDAALCFRGAAMPPTLDWRDAKMIHADEIRVPRRIAVVTGCGSYLLKPRFFDASLWDYSAAPRGAFYMDDIWISGCLDRRGVEKYVVPGSAMMKSVKAQKRTMTLHQVPNGRQNNNNEVIRFFSESWNVFPAR
ncbi:MAG TPA: hypothetical protein VF345_09500 [Chthoniobacterales bacterium]